MVHRLAQGHLAVAVGAAPSAEPSAREDGATASVGVRDEGDEDAAVPWELPTPAMLGGHHGDAVEGMVVQDMQCSRAPCAAAAVRPTALGEVHERAATVVVRTPQGRPN